MKRFAAHYIYLSPRRILKSHYLELDRRGVLVDCQPLRQEAEAISFYNGVLFLTERERYCDSGRLLSVLQQLQRQYSNVTAFEILELSGCLLQDYMLSASIYQINGLNLACPAFTCKGNEAEHQLNCVF
ncbi:MAG: hypothetical protein LBM08_02950 [Dysgonamonadaceae bacterium]|jgi:hypothetical protein|nr:hypothetical protein [Dysgonamonadaceae bacterium]